MAIITMDEIMGVLAAYEQKAAALSPLADQNGILWRRKYEKLQSEHPDTMLAGMETNWSFQIVSITESEVHARAIHSTEAQISLGKSRDSVVYFRVGRDVTLAEAEELRNGQLVPVRIRFTRFQLNGHWVCYADLVWDSAGERILRGPLP